MTHRIRLVLLAASLAVLAASCSNDDNPTTTGMGTARVRLTDAPGDYEAVNLVVTEVSILAEGATDSVSGWEAIRSTSGTFDLLTLRNGVFATLGTAVVPAGHYNQIRLKIGTGSNVVVDGVTHPLVVPSGAQTGLKIVGGFDVPEGGVVDLALDFDAARSIHVTGNGTYMLRPTVRMVTVNATGAIRGIVSAAGTTTTVTAMQADTVSATIAQVDGAFLLNLLPPGTYDVAFDADSGYRDTTVTGVAVTAGQTTNLGTVPLSPQ